MNQELPSVLLDLEDELEAEQPHSRLQPETVAWMALGVAFSVFCAAAVGGVFVVRGYLENASDAQTARVSMISGTLLVQPAGQSAWVGTSTETTLGPGTRLRTDRVSEAFITFFEYSTLRVYTDTELEVIRLSSSRFGAPRDSLQLKLHEGRVHVGVAPAMGREKSIELISPHGKFVLEDGSYTLDVKQERTHLRVAERGRAEASSDGGRFVLFANERIELGPGAVGGPTQAREELLVNGTFAAGFAGWRSGNSLGFLEGTDIVAQQSLTLDEGRAAVRFVRSGSRGTHNESFIYQEVGRDVADFSELYLSLDLKLIYQSLSGGGYMGTEYPVIMRVNYRTAGGGDGLAVFGFHYENHANNRTDFGTLVPRNVWVGYTTPVNLMTLTPRPQRIVSVQVGAGGWDYESLVANVRLSGR